MAKVIGRAAQRIISNSLIKAKPNWDVIVPSQKYRQIADMVIKTKKHNVLVKIRTTKSDHFRFSMFTVQQLSALNKHHMRDERNIGLVFFYFASNNELISVDINTLLTVKQGKFSLEDIRSMGYSITGWREFYKYFNAMLKFKDDVVYKEGKCSHVWLVESSEEAFQRSSTMRYSMGYCRKCGKVRVDFENFLTPNPTFSPLGKK